MRNLKKYSVELNLKDLLYLLNALESYKVQFLETINENSDLITPDLSPDHPFAVMLANSRQSLSELEALSFRLSHVIKNKKISVSVANLIANLRKMSLRSAESFKGGADDE